MQREQVHKLLHLDSVLPKDKTRKVLVHVYIHIYILGLAFCEYALTCHNQTLARKEISVLS